MADLTGETIYLATHLNGENSPVTFENGIMYVTTSKGESIPIRAALKNVTQKPWNRIPVTSKTFIHNPILVCLAGGRNKLLANKAYEFYNSTISETGLKISMPETIKDVSKLEIPLWVERFGGRAVIKIPYSNSGLGVFTVTTQAELDTFMEKDYSYDKFIVQSLIGHYEWSSQSGHERLFHVGTMPNKKGEIFISDLRMMVYSSPQGFAPCVIFARRARAPLEPTIQTSSWETLGTNLSIKLNENQWSADTGRMLLMDRKDFNSLGLGIDDLIEAYIQTVLTVIAIDKMAQNLLNKKGMLRMKLFKSLDNDEALIREIKLQSSMVQRRDAA